MAGIDRLNGTYAEYKELSEWLAKHKPSALKHLYDPMYQPTFSKADPRITIANFPKSVDDWLIEHCPIPWVAERILLQYQRGK